MKSCPPTLHFLLTSANFLANMGSRISLPIFWLVNMGKNLYGTRGHEPTYTKITSPFLHWNYRPPWPPPLPSSPCFATTWKLLPMRVHQTQLDFSILVYTKIVTFFSKYFKHGWIKHHYCMQYIKCECLLFHVRERLRHSSKRDSAWGSVGTTPRGRCKLC
jgi:hypothetical protein